jgi:hypothetical protein
MAPVDRIAAQQARSTVRLAARYAEEADLTDVADAMLAKAATFVDCASAKAELAAPRGAFEDAQRKFTAAVELAARSRAPSRAKPCPLQ